MDREEIAAWILPNDYDHTLNEAKHLIHEADENKVTNKASFALFHECYILNVFSTKGWQVNQKRNLGKF
jgi:hypothetical protein